MSLSPLSVTLSEVGLGAFDATRIEMQKIANAVTILNSAWLANTPDNVIVNPDCEVDQINVGVETTTANNAFWADQWRYIGEASAACTARDATYNSGAFDGRIKFTGTADKGGAFQAIENARCYHLRSKQLTLYAQIVVSNTRLSNMKMAVIEFSGAADTCTASPVSSWGAAGTNPTLAANWTYSSIPANLGATTSATRFSAQVTVSDTMHNLGILIWNDDKTYNANDSFYFFNVELQTDFISPNGNRVSLGTPYVRRLIEREMLVCQRYARKSYKFLVAPGTGSSDGEIRFIVPSNTIASVQAMGTVTFGAPMFKKCTVTIYGYVGGVGKVSVADGTSDLAAGSGTSLTSGDSSFTVSQGSGGSVTTTGNTVLLHYVALARL